VELWDALGRRDVMAREYLARMDEKGVEIILTPAQMMPAPPTGVMGTFVAGISPYIPWNVLNFPAGIAPITTYSQEVTFQFQETWNSLRTVAVTGR
jgi:hypothetical protein